MKHDTEYICVASRGRNTAPDGSIQQHLEQCPEPGKTNCLTTVAKDNLILQRPRGKNPGGLYADKSPTLTQTAWEQNNLVVENVCLTSQRTEYGKAIRRQYEAHEITEPRSTITRLEPRTDGKTNTITTVQKDNLIMETKSAKDTLIISGTYRTQKVDGGFREIKSGKGACVPARARNDGSGQNVCAIIDNNGIRIRRLTPTECARLQTVPTWYKFVVSETQQYKMLGNGWTVEVIKHIFSFLPDHFKK